jgi:hypothetical protein
VKPSTGSTTASARETVTSFVDAVLGALVEETEVARDRLAKKRGVESSSRSHGSRKSLAAIVADQAAVGRQGT